MRTDFVSLRRVVGGEGRGRGVRGLGQRHVAYTLAVGIALVGLAACAPSPAGAPAKPAAAEPAKPAAVQPAAPAISPAKPAAQPAKPAAEPAKPAAQPAKPAAQAAKPAAKDPQRMVFGTSSLSSAYGVYTVAAAKLLNTRVPAVNLTVAENGSIVNNLKRVQAGEAELAIGDQTILSMALTGQLKGWEGSPMRDIRLLWVFDPASNVTIVSERAGIRQFADLDGKSFSPGAQGSSADVATQLAFEVLGIKPQYHRGTVADMLTAFKDRRVVGFVKAMPLSRSDPVITEAMTSQPLRALSLPGDVVSKVQAKHPYLKTAQVQAGVFKDVEWNKEPIAGWNAPITVWALTRLSEDLAYAFTKAAIQDKDEQAAAFPALKGTDLAKMTAELGAVPLHRGALKALREAGFQVRQDLVPPEAG